MAACRGGRDTGAGDSRDASQHWHRSGRLCAAALAAVPDQMIDAIDVVGSPALVSDTIAAGRRAGVQVPVIFPLTRGAARNDEPASIAATLRAAAAPVAEQGAP